jgi:peptide/nickel transport system substrate-binding protein
VRKLLLAAAVALALGAAQAANAEDILRATLNSNLNNLDPAKAGGAEDYVFANLVYNGLMRVTENLEIVEDLAESYSSSEDLKTWTFKLKQGVRFHNGRSMTSDDVVKSFERILNKDTASPGRSQLLIVKDIEALDQATVRFTLEIPYSTFPELLIERQLKIVPADHVDRLSTEPIGTGPFRFKSLEPGNALVLEKNPDYFEAGLPKLDAVHFRIMPEGASKVAALLAGDIDLLWNVPLESIEQLSAQPKIKVDESSTGTWDGLVMNNAQPPFNDMRVRRAVLLAIDKVKLVEFAVFGHGAATHTPITPKSPYFNENIGFETDLPAAQKLLAEAGLADGFEVQLVVPVGRPTRERLGVAVQQMLKPLGIKVNVQRLPYNRFRTEVTGKAPFYADGYFNRPSVDTAVYPWFHSTGTWNGIMWKFASQRVDTALDAARAAETDAERKKLYEEFQLAIVEEVPGIVAYTLNFANAYNSDRVEAFHTHPYAWLDLRNVTLKQ